MYCITSPHETRPLQIMRTWMRFENSSSIINRARSFSIRRQNLNRQPSRENWDQWIDTYWHINIWFKNSYWTSNRRIETFLCLLFSFSSLRWKSERIYLLIITILLKHLSDCYEVWSDYRRNVFEGHEKCEGDGVYEGEGKRTPFPKKSLWNDMGPLTS